MTKRRLARDIPTLGMSQINKCPAAFPGYLYVAKSFSLAAGHLFMWSPLECVVQAIAQWKRSDKEELLVILQAMLEAEEDEQAADEQTLKERTQHRGPKGGRRHYERKIINGCGPYLYLRYWSSGKHRSVYIGKFQ